MQKQTSELFLWRSVLKKCSKFTGEQACQSVISIKLLCNFIEIALWHWCSTALLHVFRTLFNKNTSGGLLSLFTVFSWFSYYSDYKIIAVRVLNGVWLTFYIYKIKVCGLFRKNSVMLESTNLSLIVGNSIAIVGDSLEYPFHHLLLPHEIHFQKEFFEGNLPFICPIVMTSWIRSVSTNICNW